MAPSPTMFSLLIVLGLSAYVTGGGRSGFLSPHFGLRPPTVAEGVVLPPEMWFTQTLNHFDPTDGRQWKQKYYTSAEHYRPGGPLFLMIGGEGPASAKWMVNGTWVDYAKRFSAFLVQLEHRYYGDSHPTPDLSVKNLKYLSSEQALADLAVFISRFKEEQNLTDSKVVAFGGSYPGSLAVWFRLKYPHLVHASVSSSAPLLAQINFKEYLDVVVSSLTYKGNQNCVQQINKAVEFVSIMLQHRVGWKTLEQKLKLCRPMNGHNEKDVSNLFEILAESFEDVVQYNEDNRHFGGEDGNNVTVKTLCDIMADESIGNAFQRLVVVNDVRLNASKEACLEHTYDAMIANFTQIKWDNNTSVGGRQWIYQTCTEFGFYQTSDSDNQPFGHKFSLPFYLQQCSDIYGKRFSLDLLEKGVERTNIMYGGKSPKVTRVILINGSIDPWHYLGVTKSLADDVPAIFINGTAHCANMYPPSPMDSPQLVAARFEIANTIGKWLAEES